MLKPNILFLILLGWGVSLPALAESSESFVSPGIQVSIEVSDLQYAGKTLRDASEILASSIRKASTEVEDLSPQQLSELGKLVDKVDAVLSRSDAFVAAFPQRLEDSRSAVHKMVDDSLVSARTETIDPLLASLDRWVLWFVIGLAVFGFCVLLLVWVLFSRLQAMTQTLRSVTSDYRIVHREQLFEQK